MVHLAGNVVCLGYAEIDALTDRIAMLRLMLISWVNSREISTMSILGRLEPILEGLSEDRIRQLIDFARFLSMEQERQEWLTFGRDQLSRAYGPDEPEYTEADIRPSHDR